MSTRQSTSIPSRAERLPRHEKPFFSNNPGSAEIPVTNNIYHLVDKVSSHVYLHRNLSIAQRTRDRVSVRLKSLDRFGTPAVM